MRFKSPKRSISSAMHYSPAPTASRMFYTPLSRPPAFLLSLANFSSSSATPATPGYESLSLPGTKGLKIGRTGCREVHRLQPVLAFFLQVKRSVMRVLLPFESSIACFRGLKTKPSGFDAAILISRGPIGHRRVARLLKLKVLLLCIVVYWNIPSFPLLGTVCRVRN